VIKAMSMLTGQGAAVSGAMASRVFSRRRFFWRYCIIFSVVIYIILLGIFIPLSSSTPKVRLLPSAVSKPTLTTRNRSVASSVPRAPVVDGRRPVDSGGAPPANAAFSTKSTKKPTALEVLHKDMTLHKANMSDILKHVKAAVANSSSVNASFSNRKVSGVVAFRPGNKMFRTLPYSSKLIETSTYCIPVDILSLQMKKFLRIIRYFF